MLVWLMLAVWQVRQPGGGAGGAGGAGLGAAGGVCMAIEWIVILAVSILTIAGMWKAFEKAGQPGWAAIIPVYNIIVLLQVADKPVWWVVIWLCVPCGNIIVAIIASIAFAEKFGQGAGFGVGLALLGFIFWPILGFGSSQYQGGRRRRPRDYDEDEDEDDRPQRRRARDEEDEDEDDRPRRRPRDEDDEDDDEDRRIRRRPRDDD
jgi:uncharacterized protein DUF5684